MLLDEAILDNACLSIIAGGSGGGVPKWSSLNFKRCIICSVQKSINTYILKIFLKELMKWLI